MILPDTSAWVEYYRGTGSEVHRRLAELVATDGPLAVTEPVIMEVLIGARDDWHERGLRKFLLRFELLPFRPVGDFDSAVRIYRRCRSEGVTPRGMVDCLIAAVAWRTKSALLARDIDITRIAQVMGIGIDPASVSD